MNPSLPLPTSEFISEYIQNSIKNHAYFFSVEHGGGAGLNYNDQYIFFTLPFNDGTFQRGFGVSYRNFFRESLIIYPSDKGETTVVLEHLDLEPGTSRVHNSHLRGTFSLDLGQNLASRIIQARKGKFSL